MGAARKITVILPSELIEQAQKKTNTGLTETIKAGLKILAAQNTFQDFLKLRGKVKFTIDWNKMKEDR